jgi:sugar lactone lactonase YvrE
MLFVVESNNDIIYQYDLSTPWDVSTASSGTSKDISGDTTGAENIYVTPDGTQLYVLDSGYPDYVMEYTLSTAFDFSTASYSSNRFQVMGASGTVQGFTFKPDGTELYVTDSYNNTARQYTLSTAWDITTASYTTQQSITASISGPRGCCLSSDGAYFFVIEYATSSTAIKRYPLSTPWALSSIGSYNDSTNVNGWGIWFDPTGAFMYVVKADDTIYGYNTCSNLWDLSKFSYTSTSADLSAYAATTGIFFKPDGSKVYVTDSALNQITEYPLSTAWDVSTKGTAATGSLSSSRNYNGLFFKPDGTKVYVGTDTPSVGGSERKVYEYPLSTAWDITTMGTLAQYDVGSEVPYLGVNGVCFSWDGTKMYVSADARTIYMYDLSTPWDVTSAGFTSGDSFTADSGDINTPGQVHFKSDGTKMYIKDEITDDAIHQYSLSTAWDLGGTVTYDSVTYVPTEPSEAPGWFINATGTALWVVDKSDGTAYEYAVDCSTDLALKFCGVSLSSLSKVIGADDSTLSKVIGATG